MATPPSRRVVPVMLPRPGHWATATSAPRCASATHAGSSVRTATRLPRAHCCSRRRRPSASWVTVWYPGAGAGRPGHGCAARGDNREAGRSFEEALAAALALKDQALEAMACNNLGEVARLAGDDSEAAARYERSLSGCIAIWAAMWRCRVCSRAAATWRCVPGDSKRARAQFAESLALFRAVGQQRGVAEAIAGLAAVAAQIGTPAAALDAARLWAAVRRGPRRWRHAPLAGRSGRAKPLRAGSARCRRPAGIRRCRSGRCRVVA